MKKNSLEEPDETLDETIPTSAVISLEPQRRTAELGSAAEADVGPLSVATRFSGTPRQAMALEAQSRPDAEEEPPVSSRMDTILQGAPVESLILSSKLSRGETLEGNAPEFVADLTDSADLLSGPAENTPGPRLGVLSMAVASSPGAWAGQKAGLVRRGPACAPRALARRVAASAPPAGLEGAAAGASSPGFGANASPRSRRASGGDARRVGRPRPSAAPPAWLNETVVRAAPRVTAVEMDQLAERWAARARSSRRRWWLASSALLVASIATWVVMLLR